MNLPKIGMLVIVSAIAGVLNFFLGSLTHFINLPLFFDSIFTFVIAIQFGFFPGLITAILTNSLLALVGVVPFPFVICNIFTVLISVLFRRSGVLKQHTSYLWLGITVALANGFVGSTISYMLFQGVTDISGIDKMVMGLIVTGQSLSKAVYWAGLMTNLLDKLLSAEIVFILFTFKVFNRIGFLKGIMVPSRQDPQKN